MLCVKIVFWCFFFCSSLAKATYWWLVIDGHMLRNEVFAWRHQATCFTLIDKQKQQLKLSYAEWHSAINEMCKVTFLSMMAIHAVERLFNQVSILVLIYSFSVRKEEAHICHPMGPLLYVQYISSQWITAKCRCCAHTAAFHQLSRECAFTLIFSYSLDIDVVYENDFTLATI